MTAAAVPHFIMFVRPPEACDYVSKFPGQGGLTLVGFGGIASCVAAAAAAFLFNLSLIQGKLTVSKFSRARHYLGKILYALIVSVGITKFAQALSPRTSRGELPTHESRYSCVSLSVPLALNPFLNEYNLSYYLPSFRTLYFGDFTVGEAAR